MALPPPCMTVIRMTSNITSYIVASCSEEAADVSFGVLDESLVQAGDAKADLALTLLDQLNVNISRNFESLVCAGSEETWREWIQFQQTQRRSKTKKNRLFLAGEALVLVQCPMKLYYPVLKVSNLNSTDSLEFPKENNALDLH